MRSEIYEFNPRVAVAPQVVTGSSPVVSGIIDTLGYNALSFVVVTGTLSSTAATFAVSLEHGDAANLSDTAAVTGDDLAGTLANAAFNYSADNSARKVGYLGSKRYVRCTVTPTNNSSDSNAALAVVALLDDATSMPTPAVPT